MDATSAVTALSPEIKTAVILCLLWILNKVVDNWLSKSKLTDETVAKLTLAVNSLEIRVDTLNKSMDILPKLQADINAAHEKIREQKTNQ
jgi:hypothetical protein